MTNDRISSAVAAPLPIAALAPTAPAAAPTTGDTDFSKLVSAELDAEKKAGAVASGPSLASVMAPYAAAGAANVMPPAAAGAPAAASPASSSEAPSAPTAPEAPAAASAPTAPSDPSAPVAPAAAPAIGTYTVQHGDSLSKIAQRMGGSSHHWHELYAMNRSTVGGNPNLIKPGQVLSLPTSWQTAHAPVKLDVSLAPPVAPKAPVAPAAPVAEAAPAAPVAPVATSAAVTPEAPTEIPAPDAVAAPDTPPAKAPANMHEAQEAIERISLGSPKPGVLAGAPPEAGEAYQNNVAAMHSALDLIPKESADYEHFRKTVDGYEAAVSAAMRPAGHATVVEAAPHAAVPPAAATAPELPNAGPDPLYGPPTAEAPAGGAPLPANGASLPAAAPVQAPAAATPVSSVPADLPAAQASAPPVPTPVAALPQDAPVAVASAAPQRAVAENMPAPEPTEDPDAPPVGFY